MHRPDAHKKVRWQKHMSSEPPLGFRAALQTVELGRAAFFSHAVEDMPVAESEQIAADDLLPQFGYVGSRYENRRILLIGINPGNGPRKQRSTGDETAMPALLHFVTQRTPESFQAAQQAYRKVCQGWAVWGRQCDELLSAGGLGMEDIAFTNGLPWRTASQAAFSKAVSRKAAQLYVDPFVRQLQPNVIVAVGKRAAEMLEHAGHLSEAVVVWNRARALRPSVVADREAAAKKFSVLLSAL
jgi:hypothetical protein